MLTTTTLTWLGLVSLAQAVYQVKDDYSGPNFFNNFNFFTGDDYTHGYVNYIDQQTAQSQGLLNTNNGIAYMAADSKNVVPSGSRGRNSIRIESKNTYNAGLIIADFGHLPGGACGEWPAFWTYGPNWPNNGEIDIFEGVNSQTTNSMAVHTGPGCQISATGQQSGTMVYSNCDVNAANQPSNSGCSFSTTDTSTYGAGFNAAGGGVYAMEMGTSAGTVSIWKFSRGNIPADITAGIPTPRNWGPPLAIFGSPCNTTNVIKQQSIVFDITFCGDWAGNVWQYDSTCAPKASTCQAFVQNNPGAFANSYWSINSLRVYQDTGLAVPSSSSQLPTSKSAVASWAATSWSANVPNAPIRPSSSSSSVKASGTANIPSAPIKPASSTSSAKPTTKVVGRPTRPTGQSPAVHYELLPPVYWQGPNRATKNYAVRDEENNVPRNVMPDLEAGLSLPAEDLTEEYHPGEAAGFLPSPDSSFQISDQEQEHVELTKRQNRGPWVGANGMVMEGGLFAAPSQTRQQQQPASPTQNPPANKVSNNNNNNNNNNAVITPAPPPVPAAGSTTRITLTVTQTVYSGIVTSTIGANNANNNPAIPSTMIKTTSAAPPAPAPAAAAPTRAPNANQNGNGRNSNYLSALNANFFGGGKSNNNNNNNNGNAGPGQQQQQVTNTLTIPATATETKTLTGRDAGSAEATEPAAQRMRARKARALVEDMLQDDGFEALEERGNDSDAVAEEVVERGVPLEERLFILDEQLQLEHQQQQQQQVDADAGYRVYLEHLDAMTEQYAAAEGEQAGDVDEEVHGDASHSGEGMLGVTDEHQKPPPPSAAEVELQHVKDMLGRRGRHGARGRKGWW